MLWVKAKKSAYDVIVTKYRPVFLGWTPRKASGGHTKQEIYYPVRNLAGPCTHCPVNLICF